MDVDGDVDVVSELIDIRTPLGTLRKKLDKKMGYSVKSYDFWLQEQQILSDEMTLVDQCIQGEGLVQIKMEIANGKINIVDVLKPEEELVAEVETNKRKPQYSSTDEASSPSKIKKIKKETQQLKPQSKDQLSKWVVSQEFRQEQIRLNFPTDPLRWDRLHVSHWLHWVQSQFPDSPVDRNDWDMNGQELCSITLEEFKKKCPEDPGDTLWTHLELLKKCKFVATIQSVEEPPIDHQGRGIERKTARKPPVKLGIPKFSVMSESSPGNRTGNNGQVQLWQFLLELLTDKAHCNVIHWIHGGDGEFKLENPEMVAQLWGSRKNKPNMNYEKLSRALRYYYDGDMISKVHGKRFVYKFVCNLKQLIGYDASELNQLVMGAQEKSMGGNIGGNISFNL